jgi:hypothetical protein
MQNVWDAGFDISFRDCPAKGGTGSHPTATPRVPYVALMYATVGKLHSFREN